jgi:hypothetical protein
MARAQNKPSVQVENNQPGLKPEVADVYELSEGTLMIFADSEFGVVDMEHVNLEFAERLEKKGYLKKRDS